ncbi:MAG: hypothetical protein P4L35_19045 [Ignavibacteriaceae bacterium]|nr:hypothetical protein [Ignavibacteriaceae bacterium]
MFTRNDMNTLSEVMNNLKANGYTDDFEIEKDLLVGKETNKKYNSNELTIKKVYRFEGDSDPGDMSVLYAIETNDGHKGTYVDAFGTYGDQGTHTAEFLKHIKTETD